MAATLVLQVGYQLVALVITALAGLALYRLYLSPLAKFPGPKLAALSTAYEGYYDCLKDGGGGRYYEQIDRMHDEYGPIVRISPCEIHIRDPDWTEIYKVTRRASKYKWYYQALGPSGNVFSSADPETHRMRRDAIQPYFSPAAIARHESEVERLVGKLINRIRGFRGQDQPVNLGDAFRCFATDGATAFVFRKPFGHLDSPDFEHAANKAVRKYGQIGQFNRHSNGWLIKLLGMMPPWLALKINPGSLGVGGFFKQLGIEIQAEMGTNSRSKTTKSGHEEAQQNMMQQILTSNLPPEEKSLWRVTRECSGVTLAGTETTGSVLARISYLLLSHPEKMSLLHKELEKAYKTHGRPPSYQELKELPYLSAVINEGLRLGSVSGRLPRYDSKQDITYKEWIIPKGTIISTNLNDTNFSPKLFPSPHSFLPERWLISDENDGRQKLSSRYMLPFGRGTRMCLGMEIAMMEMYLTVGRIFARESTGIGLRLDLEDGIDYAKDVALFHDYFSPFPKSWKGIRAFVK